MIEISGLAKRFEVENPKKLSEQEKKDPRLKGRYFQSVRDVSFTCEKGQVLGLLGPNGAGKTTLLKTISGLVQARSGTIRFQDTEIQNLSAHRIVESGVSQVAEGRAMLKRMTVLENLRIGAHVRKDKEVGQDIDQIFSKFPVLGERHNQLAGLLSGGEQQMVAVARGIMSDPMILLIDEPSVGLAPNLVSHMIEKIRELKDKKNLTVLMAEQNFNQAIKIADRGYIIVHGEIEFAANSAAELADNEMIKQYYLGA